MHGREQRQGTVAERDQDVRHTLSGNVLPRPYFDPFQDMEETEESPQALLYGLEQLIGRGVPADVEDHLLAQVFDIGRDWTLVLRHAGSGKVVEVGCRVRA